MNHIKLFEVNEKKIVGYQAEVLLSAYFNHFRIFKTLKKNLQNDLKFLFP